MKMKFKKSLIAVSSILAVAGVSATIATTISSCSSRTTPTNQVAEITDDYEIKQAKYDFDAIAGMIISPRSNG
jgi:hypothetical protein